MIEGWAMFSFFDREMKTVTYACRTNLLDTVTSWNENYYLPISNFGWT